ncbi:MAG: hypothetical protein AAF219_07510 [Myxococcota bacterium]
MQPSTGSAQPKKNVSSVGGAGCTRNNTLLLESSDESDGCGMGQGDRLRQVSDGHARRVADVTDGFGLRRHEVLISKRFIDVIAKSERKRAQGIL